MPMKSTVARPPADVSPRALRWIGAISFIGVLYFVGIGLGYLIFTGILPEFRLRFILAGIFSVLFLLRAYSLFRHGVRPTRLTTGMYGLFGVIMVVQALWFVPISNAGGLETYLTTVGETIIAGGILAMTGEALGILFAHGRLARALWRVAFAFGICVLIIVL